MTTPITWTETPDFEFVRARAEVDFDAVDLYGRRLGAFADVYVRAPEMWLVLTSTRAGLVYGPALWLKVVDVADAKAKAETWFKRKRRIAEKAYGDTDKVRTFLPKPENG